MEEDDKETLSQLQSDIATRATLISIYEEIVFSNTDEFDIAGIRYELLPRLRGAQKKAKQKIAQLIKEKQNEH